MLQLMLVNAHSIKGNMDPIVRMLFEILTFMFRANGKRKLTVALISCIDIRKCNI